MTLNININIILETGSTVLNTWQMQFHFIINKYNTYYIKPFIITNGLKSSIYVLSHT